MYFIHKIGKKIIALLVCEISISTNLALALPQPKGYLSKDSSIQSMANNSPLSGRDKSSIKTRSYLPIVSIHGGGFTASPGRAQDIYIVDLIGDHYSVNKKNRSNALFGLGLSFTGIDDNRFDLTYGVNAFYFGRTTVNGVITQEQLFTNLAYSYSVINIPVYASVKGIMKNSRNDNFNLTLDIGFGPNFMSTNNFNEQSLDGGITIPNHIFVGQEITNFSAMAGVGIRISDVFHLIPVECGYRFFYLGKGNFTSFNNQVINMLNTSDNYANALICSLVI
ncbi:TPA: hypothetical protein JAN90_12380 [Legionella pneumophila]|nr:hypothetical protein [Legionella pneumophila]HAT8868489.1 hypothetical protein [Legionella pneumophila subsp. pneumophila]HAT8890655.1 hypothetical protein [Legionella pneumophila subsp. pneumophila]HAT8933596.1 hypothetical protein [Legionella pneumophila subsp. pneumophila]HAU0162488.1 hypothetical protein [Legionella pneumophila]